MSSQPPDENGEPGPARPPYDPYRFGPPEPGSPADIHRVNAPRGHYAPPPADPRYPPPKRGNGMAIAGMVLGILSILLCWIAFFDIPLIVLGIIFSVLGLGAAKRGASGRGMAIAGLTCAIVGAVAATAITVWAVRKDRSCSDKYDRGSYRYELCIRNRG